MSSNTSSDNPKNPTATGGGKKPVTSQDSGCGPSVSRHIVLEQRFKISFGVDPGFLKKTERIRSLLSSKHHKKLEFEELFEILMDEYIERHSPEGRISRKTERERKRAERDQRKAELDKKKTGRDQRKADREQRHLEKKAGKVSRVARPAKSVRITEADKSSRDSKPAKAAKSTSGTSMKLKQQKQDTSRYIPQKVRDEVYARDKGRCAFVAPGGRKCGSKWALQIDHIIPFARGGDNSPSNLRLLCAKHNRLEAQRAFGERHMEQYSMKQMEKHIENHVKEPAGQYPLKEPCTTHKGLLLYLYDH